MVWEEIAIGFTVAGFVAVLVPTEWWETIFLMDLWRSTRSTMRGGWRCASPP